MQRSSFHSSYSLNVSCIPVTDCLMFIPLFAITDSHPLRIVIKVSNSLGGCMAGLFHPQDNMESGIACIKLHWIGYDGSSCLSPL